MPFIEDGRFTHGKYAGDFVAVIARTDIEFCQWALASRDWLALTTDEFTLVESAISLPPPPPPIPPAPPEVVALALVSDALEGTVEDSSPSLFTMVYEPRPTIVWTGEQEKALDEINEWKHFRSSSEDIDSASFASLTGPAGTGKSTLVREIVSRYPDALLTAMTGKAALRLSECAGREATTLHKILYYPPKGGEDMRFTRLREPESYFVTIDESSMMSPAVFRDLQRWAALGVRFLLVGDSYQLPPVITGEEQKEFGEDWSVFSKVRGAELKTVMRSAGGVLRAAERVRETGEICEESISLDGSDYEFLRAQKPMEKAVDDYCNDRDNHFLITWKNVTRMAANKLIRARLGHEGPLPDDGEPVLIKKNGQGFMNGEVVAAAGFETGPVIGDCLRTLWMRVLGGPKILVTVDGGSIERGGEFFDGSSPWVANWKSFHSDMKKNMYPDPLPISWGYCGTCHSMQGSEARRVTVFLNREDLRSRYFRKPTTLPNGDQALFSARFVYTAISRGKTRSTMIVGK